MKQLTVVIAIGLLANVVAGCSTSKPRSSAYPSADEMVKFLPNWYIKPPRDPDYFIATGTATSRSKELARDKAVSEALMEIATAIETHFQENINRFLKELGITADMNVSFEISFDQNGSDSSKIRGDINIKFPIEVSSSIVVPDEEVQYLDMLNEAFKRAAETILSTISANVLIDKIAFGVQGSMYRSYVLVKFPLGALYKPLIEEIKQQEQLYTRFRATQVFDELNKEVEKFEQWKEGNQP